MGISSEFQALVVARLRDQIPSVPVYDRADEGAKMPYISVGPSYWRAVDAECIAARSETLQIDVWASDRPTRRVAKDVTDEVAAALKGWADTTILAMHPIELGLVRVLGDPADGIAHGVVQIEAMIEG